MTPHLYDLLDVDPSASEAEIRAAWKAAIADLDPTDRRFRVYNQAAETLLDPERRRAYDAELAAQEPEPADDATAEEAAPPRADRRVAEPAPGPAAAADVSSRRVVPTWLLIGLAVLLLVVGSGTIYLATQPSEAAVEAATSSARVAAQTAAEPLLSYDYRTLDQDQRDAERYLTSRYRAKYDQLFSLISDNAPRTKTVVTAHVLDTAVVRAGEDRVQILIFVDQSRTNAASSQPTVFKNQATLTMQKVDGEWLVDGLTTSPVAQ